ncbi:MAG: acetyl-CoA carboxylase carboxyltransferase subunit alpha [Isosphaeraceae bacterium]
MANGPNEYRLPFETPIFDMEARLAELETQLARTKAGTDPAAAASLSELVRRIRRELAALKRTVYTHLDPWQTVLVSRHPRRPQSRDYLELVFDRFVELHGDRAIGDDQALVTGFAHLGDRKVMFIGHQKGKNLAERKACNFGCAHPEGYRKALLKMRMAAKFGLPIICLIDTPGAYPGIGAEERGQAAIIAENLMVMSQINTPIVCVVISEGGSGGALGIGIGDKVGMLEHAYYSVISPEGCATILWKGAEHAPRAAEALKMTSRDLLRMGIIDEIVPEPLGGAHRDHREAAANLKSFLLRSLREIEEPPRSTLLQRRYDKFRCIGVFEEGLLPTNGSAIQPDSQDS